MSRYVGSPLYVNLLKSIECSHPPTDSAAASAFSTCDTLRPIIACKSTTTSF